MLTTVDLIELEERYGAHNYHPLGVVLERGAGAWVYDIHGRRYLDCLSAYSAVNQGHCHPRIVNALAAQAGKLTLTSRAFRNDQLPLLLEQLHYVTGRDMALLMNSGAEAVETAIKAARKWGYETKRIPRDRAEIVVCGGNFHGRTVSIISFSTEAQYRDGFGPFTPGFVVVPFGDAGALEAAITPNTCAFLVEPIQGEAGIIVPPDGYLREAAEICRRHDVLFIVDEIQSGLGRAGKLFAFQHEQVEPDGIIVGKALGGGFYPVSAFAARRDVMKVFRPGDHGSTFGGNPLACAVAREALDVIIEEGLPQRSLLLGGRLMRALRGVKSPVVREVRGRGLWVGVDLTVPARPYCEALREEGLLCKDTHETVIRLAPPLVVGEDDLEWAIDRLSTVLAQTLTESRPPGGEPRLTGPESR
jgi:ornithine--oxo-acid transaminase